MTIPRRLRTRLLLSHLVVAFAALGTVLAAVSLVGPGYFAEAMGHGPGDPQGQAMEAATLAAFQDAIRTALTAATLIALGAAVVLSLALSGRVAGPVSRLAAAARRIAAGHYSERVPESGQDEVGELAGSFNAMAASLEATERRRLELVGDVAHELRTPIATLDGYLEGLQDGVVPPDSGTWTLLRRETSRLARLVDDLSQLWRAEARQLPLTIVDVDVAAVVEESLEGARPVAAERAIELVSSIAPGLRVTADRVRVAQILDNYLSNAVRYAPEHTRVELVAVANGAEIRVGVRDHGRGLTPDQRRRVFERFYRVDPSRSRALGGSGIGLPIARALADAMDGRAWAESDGPGTGSTFWVSLPAARGT
jgi:two-component system sensor histidine kinase BaeS